MEARAEAEQGMFQLGKQAAITFDFNVLTQWQPLESQRLLLWAGHYGMQEEFMTNLNRRHFERKESASLRDTLLDAAEEVGLDRDLANQFLDTNEYVAEVWKSYGSTIREKGIHSIPMFVYNVPKIGAQGGPFRSFGTRPPWVVRGSMSEAYFFNMFETIASKILKKDADEDADGGTATLEHHESVQTEVEGGAMCKPTKNGENTVCV